MNFVERQSRRGKIISGGRLQIPVAVRESLGLRDGDTVTMEVVNEELVIRTERGGIRHAQELVRHLLPADGARLSDELINDRRREAENE